MATGELTKGQLRGPGYLRLFPDVYVDARAEPDLRLRARAAWLHSSGVVAGWAAAELLGAGCGPRGVPVEIVLPGHERRPRPGLVVRRNLLRPGEVTEVDGVTVTTPLRTAYDLARRSALVEGVVAVDALARVGGFLPDDVLRIAAARPGDRGLRDLRRAVALADPRAESPMESRVRAGLALAGLPAPQVQHPAGPYLLDLAYPVVRLGVEYDGAPIGRRPGPAATWLGRRR